MLRTLEGGRIVAIATIALWIGCAVEEPGGEAGRDPTSPGSGPFASELERHFGEAADEFGVPVEILKAWSYAESRWEMLSGGEELEGLEPAWGLFGLRGATLDEAADLAGEEPAAVRKVEAAHVRAGAALLASLAEDSGLADPDDLSLWAPALALASGIADPEAQAQYIHDQVYAVLASGARVETEEGLVAALEPHAVEAAFPAPRRGQERAVTDFPGAIWRASPNYNSRPSGTGVGMVIIHTCEGNYAGCWGWLANSESGVSAHYVVADFGEVTQLVRESNRAWHIAAAYECSRNDGVDCGRNGQSSNNFTVGIEHAGFASQSSFPTAQIEASAALACDISQSHGVPRDRNHFVAHGQLQPWNRVDPGPNWPWTSYINRMNDLCGGGGGGGGEIIVDSNNANNDPARARVEVSASWTGASATPGYYGTGYYFTGTEAVSDGAVFWFHLDQAGSRAIDGWWTAGSNRSASTPFVAFNAAGAKLGTSLQDQRGRGGQWNGLGTFAFTAGWNKVVVSRWTAPGAVVIADAIRVR